MELRVRVLNLPARSPALGMTASCDSRLHQLVAGYSRGRRVSGAERIVGFVRRCSVVVVSE